jgi:hypothetical protein
MRTSRRARRGLASTRPRATNRAGAGDGGALTRARIYRDRGVIVAYSSARERHQRFHGAVPRPGKRYVRRETDIFARGDWIALLTSWFFCLWRRRRRRRRRSRREWRRRCER